MSFKKFLIATGFAAAAATAHAIPTLDVITGDTSLAGFTETGAESVLLTDTDGVNDSVIANMLFEFAGYESSFGIYAFADDGFGNISLGDTLEVFNAADEPGVLTQTSVFFDLGSNTAWIDAAGGTGAFFDSGVDTSATIGANFGFYLDIPAGKPGDIWYSHTSLNSDSVDHLAMFETASFNGGVILAWEDLNNGGDMDYNDMVIGVANVIPVAEPAAIALIGLGLLGLGLARRRTA